MRTWRALLGSEVRWPRKVSTPAEAVRYINAVGYCLKVSIKGLPLPSLYFAVARRDIREGPGWDNFYEKIWRWKDDLPRRRLAFYGKYFRGRGTFISLEMLPHFLAMEGAAVAARDHVRFYSEGRVGEDARLVWETLERHGALATLELRHACRMDTRAGNVRFKRAMLQLERMLLVVHCGAERETAAWASARYELTCRAFPRQSAAAGCISPPQARAAIAAKYLEWHPETEPRKLARLFGWPKVETLRAMGLQK